MDNQYILYLAQQSNFQTRSMIIPAKEFIDARKDEYAMLKRLSSKNHKFILDQKEYIIDNLLVQNYNLIGNIGSQEKHEHTDICNLLSGYADGLDDYYYFDMCDKPWYDKSIINLCGGFNHVKNYISCKVHCKNKGIDIIDGFLILQSRNGQIEIPYCDTVNELYKLLH